MLRKILILQLLLITMLTSYGQVVTECPQNIGFESNTFNNWECFTGIVGGSTFPQLPTGEVSLQSSGQVLGRHSIIRRSGAVDPYGGFSLNAPNGSDYVVRLGNDEGGAGAESISYTLTVPANVDAYSIIFNYAVVFESPTHLPAEQPRFRAQVFDLTTNSSTSCGSFDFVAPRSGQGLPGFLESPINRPGGNNNNGTPAAPSPILYKSWSPVLVNLSDYIGHTIRLEFTTNDCTFMRHFGYAYIDFNENCSIPITGNVTCNDATSITLKTLPGFFSYNWYYVDSGISLGTKDSVVLSSPLPHVDTKIAVDLVPYRDLGCPQTLYTIINNMSLSISNPPPDCNSVDITTTSVTVGNSSDLTYTYFRNSSATQLIPDPKHITVGATYWIKATSSSGCTLVKPVLVTIIPPPDLPITQPDPVPYPGTVDITATFPHNPVLTYSYWTTSDTTVRLPNPTKIGRRGTYYIKTINSSGCYNVKPVTVEILIDDIVVPNTFTPNGDGVNDVLTVLTNTNINIKFFRIYNRWGTMVYETPDINNYWTGFKENAMVPVGTYYWVIEGAEDSKKYRRSGSVTVIR